MSNELTDWDRDAVTPVRDCAVRYYVDADEVEKATYDTINLRGNAEYLALLGVDFGDDEPGGA